MSAPEWHSPLEGHLPPGRHGAAGLPGVTLAECRMALHEIAARRGQDPGLPPPGRGMAAWGGTALRLGPASCLLLGGAAPDLPRAAASVIDQTGGFVVLRLAGPDAAAALARLCRLDLHDDAFPDGACARTVMAQVPVVLHRAGALAYHLVVPATCAVSFVHSLLHAARDFGCAVLPPVTPEDQ